MPTLDSPLPDRPGSARSCSQSPTSRRLWHCPFFLSLHLSPGFSFLSKRSYFIFDISLQNGSHTIWLSPCNLSCFQLPMASLQCVTTGPVRGCYSTFCLARRDKATTVLAELLVTCDSSHRTYMLPMVPPSLFP